MTRLGAAFSGSHCLPGLLFVIGGFAVAESPRWLFRRGQKQLALDALLRSRSNEQAHLELEEMEIIRRRKKRKRESVLPEFAATQIRASVSVSLRNSGLESDNGNQFDYRIQHRGPDPKRPDGRAGALGVTFSSPSCKRWPPWWGCCWWIEKGRKFLLSVGTAGLTVSLLATAFLFHRSERSRVDAGPAVQSMLEGRTDLTLNFTSDIEQQWLTEAGHAELAGQPTTLTIIYSYGDFSAVTPAALSNHSLATPVQLRRSNCVPANKVLAFFSDPSAISIRLARPPCASSMR